MEELINYLVKEELKPALGCTEPISVAFTASVAGKHLAETGANLLTIDVELDKNVFKNGKDVSIPSPIPLRGNLYAAPLGALIAQPEKGLQILQDLSPTLCEAAKKLVETGMVKLSLNPQAKELFVKVTLKGTNNQQVTAICQQRHDRLVFISKNGEVLLDTRGALTSQVLKQPLSEIPFDDYYSFLETYHPAIEIQTKLDQSMAMNRKVMEAGLAGVGTGVGTLITKMTSHACPTNHIISRCAAAVDARMAGHSLPVMSVTGSGNQGLIVFLVHDLYAEQINAPKECLYKSILLAIFLAGKIKAYSGRLSALCGCVIAAGMASASGLSYLEGLSKDQVGNAFNIMASDIMGILCDGAKSSCAIKSATGVNSLLRSLQLVKKGFSIPPLFGIIGKTVDETIINIGKISNPGMLETDQEILKIMTAK